VASAAPKLGGAFKEMARRFSEEHGDGVVSAQVDLEHLRLRALQLLGERCGHELQRRCQVNLSAHIRPFKLEHILLQLSENRSHLPAQKLASA